MTTTTTAPCATCGRPTTNRVWRQDADFRLHDDPRCADTEGCGKEYADWLAEREAPASYEAETERLLTESREQRERTAEAFGRWVELCSFTGEPWDVSQEPDACAEHPAGCGNHAHSWLAESL